MTNKKDRLIKFLCQIVVVGCVLIAGCSLTGCSTLNAAWNYGAAANDKALSSAEAIICKGASSGAISRRYGLNSERARARRILCGMAGEAR